MTILEEMQKLHEEIHRDVKEYRDTCDKRIEEVKEQLTPSADTKEKIAKIEKSVDAMEERLQKLQVVKSGVPKFGEGGGSPERKDFSLPLAVRGLAHGNWTGAELEQRNLFTKQFRADGGFERKAILDETGSSGGAYLIPDEFSSDYVKIAYDAMVFSQMPVRRMSTAAETLRIPSMTSGATAYMVGSGDAITVSTPVFGQSTMTAHKVGAFVPIANELVRRSDPSVMNIVNEDLLKAIGLKAESQFIEGDGSSDNMTGILNTSNIGSVSMGTDGAAFSDADALDNLMAMIRNIEMSNGKMQGFLMNSRTKWDLRAQKTSVYDYILTLPNNVGDPALLLSYPYWVTNQIPNDIEQGESGAVCSYILAGQWDELVIATWLEMSLTASATSAYVVSGTTYSCQQTDETAVSMIASYDILARTPAYFCKLIGIKTSF